MGLWENLPPPPESGVVGNPEFVVGWAEMWVAWAPYLWLVPEVRVVLQDQTLKPVESDVNSRLFVSEVN